jgi:hypothetical protein
MVSLYKILIDKYFGVFLKYLSGAWMFLKKVAQGKIHRNWKMVDPPDNNFPCLERLSMLDTRPLRAVLKYIDWRVLRQHLLFYSFLESQRFFHPQECLYMIMEHSLSPHKPLALGFMILQASRTEKVFCVLGKREGLSVWVDSSSPTRVYHSDFLEGVEAWIRFGLEGFIYFLAQTILNISPGQDTKYIFLDRHRCQKIWQVLPPTEETPARPFFLNPSFFHAIETCSFRHQSYVPIVLWKHTQGYYGLCLLGEEIYQLHWVSRNDGSPKWILNVRRWLPATDERQGIESADRESFKDDPSKCRSDVYDRGKWTCCGLSQILSRFGKERLAHLVFDEDVCSNLNLFFPSEEAFDLWVSTLHFFEFTLFAEAYDACHPSGRLSHPLFLDRKISWPEKQMKDTSGHELYRAFFGSTYYVVS